MRKFLMVATAAVLFQGASLAQADGLSFSINVGGPPIIVSQPPEFIYPSELGFGVAVGVPYDMFYLGGVYYVFRGGSWYRTYSYGGSWVRVRNRELPPEFRRHNIQRIHSYRDREYRIFSRDREHYGGQRFVPGREMRHDMRPPVHEERHDMRPPVREERHDMRPPVREERHDMRPPVREEHREVRPPVKEERHDMRPPVKDEHRDNRAPGHDERGGERHER